MATSGCAPHPAVVALRERFGYPGMCVLQQAFGGQGNPAFLPQAQQPNSVVYTGTHDNDTVLGWWRTASAAERREAMACLGSSGEAIHWDMVRAACACAAGTTIFPLQDLIGLGSEARMNLPGQGAGWWKWRFRWDQVPVDLAARLAGLCAEHRRIPESTNDAD